MFPPTRFPAQDKFKTKHKLSIALASDEKHRMLEAYGVWQEKSMYGRKFMGIVRTTVLIGPDQRIARVWPKVSVSGHAEEVLAAASRFEWACVCPKPGVPARSKHALRDHAKLPQHLPKPAKCQRRFPEN